MLQQGASPVKPSARMAVVRTTAGTAGDEAARSVRESGEEIVQSLCITDLAVAAEDLDLELAAREQLDLPALPWDGDLQTDSILPDLFETISDPGSIQTT